MPTLPTSCRPRAPTRRLRVAALLLALAAAPPAAAQPAAPPPPTPRAPASASAPASAPAPAPAPAPADQAPASEVVVVTPPAETPPVPIAIGPAAAPLPPVEEAEPQIVPPYFPVNFSLLYPLATNAAAPELWTHLDLAILLGRVGFLDGLQIGLFTWTVRSLRGVQIGVASVSTGYAEALQIGGGFAFTDGPLFGAQIAGVFGWASEEIGGLQIAGVANQTYGDLNGVQAAGFVNIARREVTGVQAAIMANVGRVTGVQIGGINVSQEQRGLQIGVLNVARKIDGLQIGVVNVTDDLQGESLGIIPLPRRGGIRLALWGSTSLYGNVGVKFSSVYAYTILSGALHSEPAPDGGPARVAAWAGGITMGARFPLDWEELSLSGDLGAYRLLREGQGFSGHDELFKARVIAAYALAPRLSVFLGGGVYAGVRGEDTADEVRYGPEIAVGLEL